MKTKNTKLNASNLLDIVKHDENNIMLEHIQREIMHQSIWNRQRIIKNVIFIGNTVDKFRHSNILKSNLQMLKIQLLDSQDQDPDQAYRESDYIYRTS